MLVAKSNTKIGFFFVSLILLLTTEACRTVPSYDKMLYQLNQLKAGERWRVLRTFPKDVTEPSSRLVRASEKLDHISQVQSLLLLSDMKQWDSGVAWQVMQLVKQSNDRLVRAAGLLALSRNIGLSSNLRRLLENSLKDTTWQVRRYGLRTWMDLEGPSQRLDSWCRKLLKDPHPAVRWDAVLCWRKRSQNTSTRAMVLKPMLQDSNFQVQQLVIHTLGWWGFPALPTLQQALESSNEEVKCNSLRALSELRTNYKTIVPLMLKSFRSTSTAVRSCALRALGKISPYSTQALNQLIQIIQSKNMLLSMDAISYVKKAGNMGVLAIPALLNVTKDPKQPLFKRYEAVQAVIKLAKGNSKWKKSLDEADSLLEPLRKKAQASLFGRSPNVPLESAILVSFKNAWSIGEKSQPLLFHIRENYLGMLQMCDLVDSERKPVKRKSFWVELFLQRHGEVVLPFVFKTDKQTPAKDPCLEDNLWTWKFPVLSKRSRFAYLQFKLVLERNEPTTAIPQ